MPQLAHICSLEARSPTRPPTRAEAGARWTAESEARVKLEDGLRKLARILKVILVIELILAFPCVKVELEKQ